MPESKMQMTRLRKVVSSVCSRERNKFVRSVEYFDSGNKSGQGMIELLLVADEPLDDGVNQLGLELDDAVKEEFGENNSVLLTLKFALQQEQKTELDQEFISKCLATVRPLYNRD
jgi:hypothetical protein